MEKTKITKKKLKPVDTFGPGFELTEVGAITVEFNPKDFIEVWGRLPKKKKKI